MQKYANLVDLENPEKMSIWSLSELSIQPRTSLSKFEGDFISSFIRLLSQDRLEFRLTLRGVHARVCNPDSTERLLDATVYLQRVENMFGAE